MFNKAYVEITNICNLRCSFCHGTKRPPAQMSAEDFNAVADKLQGHTKYIYLHLMGEPLLHPELSELLHIASEKGMNCCITTNGFLLKQNAHVLLNAEKLYKLSVSLHSFEANDSSIELCDYLQQVWEVCLPLSQHGTICVLRLWNEGGADFLNNEITDFIREKVGSEWPVTRTGSFKLSDNLYLENSAKFNWPDMDAAECEVQFCHGLRDQIAVLCDGTVVPCCLDADGEINLGNIFTQTVDEILSSPRAKAIYDGFSNRKPSEELCRKCGYATRFNK